MSALFLFASLALAQEASDGDKRGTSASFTDDFELRYYIIDRRLPDPDDVPVFNYVEQVNRFNASVTAGDVTLEAQLDEVALFATQYWLDTGVGPERVFSERQLLADEMFAPFATNNPGELNRYGYLTLEKIRARVEKGGYTLNFGDTYAAFGRGMALNLNRNVDIDIDTSIQGFKGVFRPGAWDVVIVAGQLNRQQVFQDNPNRDLVGDRRHAVAGLRLDRYGLGPANVGAHVVAYDFVNTNGWWDTPVQLADEEPRDGTSRGIEELGTPVDAVIGGATLELTGVGGIDWFVEGDVYGFPTDTLPMQVANENSRKFFEYGTALRPEDVGYATYVSAGFYPGKTTWLVELKRYYQAERVNSLLANEFYEVAVAPTAEYEIAINEDSSAALNSEDIVGGRVRMDYAARPGELVPYVALGVYRDMDLGVLHFNATPETIVHPVLGVEYIHEESSVIANAGYRRDIRDKAEIAGPCNAANRYRCDPGADQQLWADAAIRFPFVAGLHAEYQATFEVWTWGFNEFQQTDYAEVTSGFTVQSGSALAVTVYNDFTNNPLVDSTGNLPIPVGEDEAGDPVFPVYGALEVQVKPTSALTMKAFAGAYKAGIRCSGGQCRQLPGFEGARFSVQGAF